MTAHAGRRRSTIATAAGVALALAGALVVLIGLHATSGPPQPANNAGQLRSPQGPAGAPTVKVGRQIAGQPSRPPSGTNRAGAGIAAGDTARADLGPSLPASPPVSIDIPSIGVHTDNLVPLSLAGDGTLESPTDFSSVGWFAAGPSPGQLGPAILAGHVDSHQGPAIFYRLGSLRPGARVTLARQDGSAASFTIDRVQRFPKDQFPAAQVYRSTRRAELRLITCGGSFDPKSGHYADNIVAFAHLVS